jgi:hypothetical protein
LGDFFFALPADCFFAIPFFAAFFAAFFLAIRNPDSV